MDSIFYLSFLKQTVSYPPLTAQCTAVGMALATMMMTKKGMVTKMGPGRKMGMWITAKNGDGNGNKMNMTHIHLVAIL